MTALYDTVYTDVAVIPKGSRNINISLTALSNNRIGEPLLKGFVHDFMNAFFSCEKQ